MPVNKPQTFEALQNLPEGSLEGAKPKLKENFMPQLNGIQK